MYGTVIICVAVFVLALLYAKSSARRFKVERVGEVVRGVVTQQREQQLRGQLGHIVGSGRNKIDVVRKVSAMKERRVGSCE